VDIRDLYALRIRTPRLELRLGSHDELVELAHLAERGVHPPDRMPFAVAWTDGIGEPDFVDVFVAHHVEHLDNWSPTDWQLNLLVWANDALVGTQGIQARDFGSRRCVATGSWLGREHQGRGIGTEMRAAVLELAFVGLGAVEAESSWLEGNAASKRVSEKLGYVEHTLGEKSPRGVPVVEHGVAIRSAAWRSPVSVTFAGLEPCLELLGAEQVSR